MKTCGNCESYVFDPGAPGACSPSHYCDEMEWDGLGCEDELNQEVDCELWREKSDPKK